VGDNGIVHQIIMTL